MATIVDRGAITTAAWNEPPGLRPRGTVFVLAGAGEPPPVYARLAARLASDAYRVVVISSADPLDTGAQATIAGLINDENAVLPKVLIGSDVGGVAVRALIRDLDVHPDAVILAGYPTGSGHESEWDDEIAARTSCPTHRAVLREHARPHRPDLITVDDVALGVPALAIHGSADTISPLTDAIPRYVNAGVTRAVVVDDGRHDILNDITHRSVAASIVLFLEQLRSGAAAPNLIRVIDLPV